MSQITKKCQRKIVLDQLQQNDEIRFIKISYTINFFTKKADTLKNSEMYHVLGFFDF